MRSTLRTLIALAMLTWLPSLASAQGDVRRPGAGSLTGGPTLPASCSVYSVFIKTGAGAGLYECLSANVWTAVGGAGGTPGGANTQVQYNNAGAFGGITGATTNGTALTLVAPVLGTPASVNLSNALGLTETGLSLADNTTNNASATQHGFVPKGLFGAWTVRTTPNTLSQVWQSVAWSPTLNLFAAVAGHTGFGNTGSDAMTSPDGVTWTVRSTPHTGQDWENIIWAPTLNLFVATSSDGVSTSAVMTSPDGIIWTPRTTPATGQFWEGLTWAPALNLLVAVSDGGTGSDVMTSPDGITWTARSTPNTGQSWNSIAFDTAHVTLVAVSYGNTGSDVMTSGDGITWTPRTTPTTNRWYSIAFAPGLGGGSLAVIGGSQAGLPSGQSSPFPVMTSDAGVTWTLRAAPVTGQNWGGTHSASTIMWAASLGLFVATSDAETGRDVITSPDGFIWTAHTTPNDGQQWYGLAWSPALSLLAVMSSSAIGSDAMTSPTGFFAPRLTQSDVGLGNVPNLDPRLGFTASAPITSPSFIGPVNQTTSTVVGSLPTCNAGAKGTRAFVSDATATTFLSTVAGGGANNVPVTCDGTNWKIG